jgi:putative ABC transport system permease protein
LYQISPTDPIAFVASASLLTAIALIASYVPARRATRIDPTGALRAE